MRDIASGQHGISPWRLDDSAINHRADPITVPVSHRSRFISNPSNIDVNPP